MLAFFTALVLLCGLAVPAAAVENTAETPGEADLYGTWRLDRWVTSVSDFDRSGLDALGYDCFVVFREDGSMVYSTCQGGMVIDTDPREFGISGEGRLISNGAVIPFSLEDGRLTIAMSSGSRSFVRCDPEVFSSFATPGSILTETDPQLLGTWQLREIHEAELDIAPGALDQIGYEETVGFTEDHRFTMVVRYGGKVIQEGVNTFHNVGIGAFLVEGLFLEHYRIEGDRLTLIEPDHIFVFTRTEE